MNTSEAIWSIVKQYTDTVYFVPGGGAAFLVDALGRSGLKHISALHEQGAGFMAIGHAMATNGLGVCLVTSGPGATNAITPCAAAWMDSIPVLFISGQARSDSLIGDTGLRTRGVQEVDIISMVKPVTKQTFCAIRREVVRVITYSLIKVSLMDRRGPCWLDVPLNVQAEEV